MDPPGSPNTARELNVSVGTPATRASDAPPDTLIRIDSVPQAFINQLWSQVRCTKFESPASESNIRLFNDLVRSVMQDNHPLPHLSDVSSMVSSLLLFMLASEECPEEDSRLDDVPEPNIVLVTPQQILMSSDTARSDITSLASPQIELPYSLQALEPAIHEPAPAPPGCVLINLDGDDVFMREEDFGELIDHEGVLMNESEFMQHLAEQWAIEEGEPMVRDQHTETVDSSDPYGLLTWGAVDDVMHGSGRVTFREALDSALGDAFRANGFLMEFDRDRENYRLR
ncbi:uncharacterized protein N0V89_007627 [Didymosphaeria variabile]|uniref:Uncharacterized protein n=1 Tax=Didymosphaeria variabile TaxID=1932322 RepID=A0A9W8XJG4_9PLEO|nr:uncharacterized protein N0V89_007627 [Didymosphaeria variabile]KAJ4352279.1 hypothetical protein N0V89_007627 [Didymosphaeria variabile]